MVKTQIGHLFSISFTDVSIFSANSKYVNIFRDKNFQLENYSNVSQFYADKLEWSC